MIGATLYFLPLDYSKSASGAEMKKMKKPRFLCSLSSSLSSSFFFFFFLLLFLFFVAGGGTEEARDNGGNGCLQFYVGQRKGAVLRHRHARREGKLEWPRAAVCGIGQADVGVGDNLAGVAVIAVSGTQLRVNPPPSLAELLHSSPQGRKKKKKKKKVRI
jgi:hypothetical protein